MAERIGKSGWDENEQSRELPVGKIEDLLPRYYETHDSNLRYEIIDTYDYDGHEVAWMKFGGTIEYDMTGNGREGEEYSGCELGCVCKFTEGIGWKIGEDGRVYGLMTSDKCAAVEAYKFKRQNELACEYTERFVGEGEYLDDHIQEITLDLIQKEQAGEFIGERPGGARFWGGHFYADLVQKITQSSWPRLHGNLRQMLKNKQIQMDGMVIQSYYEPPAPHWDEYGRYSRDDYTVIIKLPAHSHMSQQVTFDLLAGGRVVAEAVPGPSLVHMADFGVDVEDMQAIETAANGLIDAALHDPQSFS